MSIRVNKSVGLTSGVGAVVDLQTQAAINAGSTNYNQVGYLRLTALKTGASASDFFVQPVTVQPGGAVPAAPSVTPGVGGPVDWVHVISGSGYESQELGQKYAPGYSSAQQTALGAPVATHLLIWCAAAGDLVVVGQ